MFVFNWKRFKVLLFLSIFMAMITLRSWQDFGEVGVMRSSQQKVSWDEFLIDCPVTGVVGKSSASGLFPVRLGARS